MSSLPPLPFAVRERVHARARHIRISVNAAGEVLLTIPRGATKSEARAFLLSRVEWVREQLARQQAHAPRHGQRLPLWDGHDQLPVRGVEHRLLWTRARVTRLRVRFEPDYIEVFAPAESRPTLLTRALRQALVHEARLEGEDLLNAEAHRLGVRWTSLRIGDPRAQWGSCTREGAISLSWRLLLAPAEVFRYVVVHELCHLRHADHSPRFWALVERQMPDYLEQREWLRHHGAALHQWLAVRRGAEPAQPDLFG